MLPVYLLMKEYKSRNPAIFERCIEKLGVKADECLYVGDGGSYELEAAADIWNAGGTSGVVS